MEVAFDDFETMYTVGKTIYIEEWEAIAKVLKEKKHNVVFTYENRRLAINAHAVINRTIRRKNVPVVCCLSRNCLVVTPIKEA